MTLICFLKSSRTRIYAIALQVPSIIHYHTASSTFIVNSSPLLFQAFFTHKIRKPSWKHGPAIRDYYTTNHTFLPSQTNQPSYLIHFILSPTHTRS